MGEFEFVGPLWEWRGPAPYFFVSVTEEEAELIGEVAAQVTYGWGMIPVTVRIGAQTYDTSLWPKDGGYIVPVRAAVRRAEDLTEGDPVEVSMQIRD